MRLFYERINRKRDPLMLVCGLKADAHLNIQTMK